MLANLKIYLMLGAIVMAYGAGFYTEYRFGQAHEANALKKAVYDAGKATSNIITFNGKLDNAHKDDCYNRPLPADVRKLL